MHTGKRVLITAAASGIGLAIARGFAAEGAKVHVCDISEDALRALKQSDPSITSTLCDVSDRSSVERDSHTWRPGRIGEQCGCLGSDSSHGGDRS